MLQIVKELEVLGRQQRRRRIASYLTEWEVDFEEQAYSTGVNLWVPNHKKPFVGISSHFDTVPFSPGANDNASAVAVCLNVLQRNLAHPLQNLGLQFFFFDEEEKGLRGSRAFLQRNDISGLIGLINMELVGMGNQFAFWPLEEGSDSQLLRLLEAAAKEMKTPSHRIGHLIMHSADHQAFREKGLGDSALTISCISDADVAVVEHYFKAQFFDVSQETLWEIAQQAPIFEHYHQPSDLSIHLSESALQQCTDLIWRALEKWDKELTSN